MIALRIEGMAVARAGRRLVESLHCQASPGSVTVILGPNGAGKSTLLQMLAGVLAGTGLPAYWRDRRLDTYPRAELADVISWQGPVDYADFGLRVGERLRLSAGHWTGRRAEAVLDPLDVLPLMARPLAELSSGERQRVEVAAAMLRDTPVLLLDEPTAHLDLKHQDACLRLIRHQAGQGRIVLAVLHDVAQAAAVADQLMLLYGDGGSDVGPAAEMLVPARLEGLYGMPMRAVDGGVLPDFGRMT
jgi:iron complex transport system ATP-binding protein